MIEHQFLLNMVRREVARYMAATSSPLRLGTIDSYDPSTHAVKVKLQPDGTITGFMPLGSPWVGNGWGLFLAPALGAQVIVDFQEGGLDAPVAMLRMWGSKNRPLNVPSGEAWLVHQLGSFLKLTNDGKLALNGHTEIDATAPVVNITTTGNVNATVGGDMVCQITGKFTGSATEWDLTGNLNVTGNILASGSISDVSGAHGTLGNFRDHYKVHFHAVRNVQAGTSTINSDQTDAADQV